MSLAEGVQARVTLKAYSSAAITAGSEPDPFTAPGTTGGQILRRVSSSLALQKDTYQANEVVSHRQVTDYRHGAQRVTGGINGELSPATYEECFEACLRGTWSSAVIADSNTEFTSAAASNSGSTFTFAGGNPVTEGYRIGDVIQFSNLSEAANNGINFVIVALAIFAVIRVMNRLRVEEEKKPAPPPAPSGSRRSRSRRAAPV